MKKKGILVFTACYNERANIGPLIDQVFATVSDVDMLVLDDNSPDGTWDVITFYMSKYPRLHAVKRPGKRGVGSAHKYALYYAMREGYDKVVTLDADFSHDPKAIPGLLAESARNVFVTGSRYCEGGSCEYSGYRNLVSRIGNFAARHLLNLPLHELTTYFRVFDVASLHKLPFHLVQSDGYSYGVQLVYYLNVVGVGLREAPIYFSDRLHGQSKLPRHQIVVSAVDLIRMWASRTLRLDRNFQAEIQIPDRCALCGDRVLALKISGVHRHTRSFTSGTRYKDGAKNGDESQSIYTCLNCGHDQVRSSIPSTDSEPYCAEASDRACSEPIPVSAHHFARRIDQIAKFMPVEFGLLLAIGPCSKLFLEEAKKRGWEAEGFDSLQQVRKDALPTKKCDAIVSWDVIEYVREPVDFLRQCNERLTDNGILFLLMSDNPYYKTKLFRAKSRLGSDKPIQYFREETIRTALDRAGFDLVTTEPSKRYVWTQDFLDDSELMFRRLNKAFDNVTTQFILTEIVFRFLFGGAVMYIAHKRLSPSTNSTMSGEVSTRSQLSVS